MAATLVSQATFLYRLQSIDLNIDQHNARLAEIQATLDKDQRVAQAQTQLDQATQVLTPWQTRSRNLDLEIKSLVQKIQMTEQRLYSGKVSNPKELEDIQNDIVSLKKRQSQLEDELLEAMVKVEEGQAAVSAAQDSLDAAKADWSTAQAGLISERDRLKQEVVKLQAQRKQAAESVEPANLSKYETLRPKKRGQVVAVLKDNSCVTCGVEQTSMLAQQVRQGGQLVYCANCGRILATP